MKKANNINSKYLRFFFILTLLIILTPFRAEAKKWSYRDWADRNRERDARFNSLATTRPNVFKNYVNNVNKANGVTGYNAWEHTVQEIISQKTITEVTATNPNLYYNQSTTLAGNLATTVLNASGGRSFITGSKGDYISFTAAGGKAYFCVGWGCTTSVKVDKGGGNICTAQGPSGKLSLKDPKNKEDIILEGSKVTLSWNAINSFGTCCSATCNKRYFVYIGEKGKALQKAAELGTNKTSVNVGVVANKTYQWYVMAINTETGAVRSDTWEFTVLPGTQTVTGVIWNSTGQACNVDHESTEITRSQLTGNVSVTAGGVSGTWNTNPSGRSFRVTDVPYGENQIICANVPEPADMPNFRYVLNCADNSSSGIISKSCATLDVLGPTTRDLGFRLDSKGWFHSIGGDVYSGCSDCIDGISLGLPDSPLGGFVSYLVNGVAGVFSRSDMSVKDSEGEDRYTSDDNKQHAEFIGSNFWPRVFQFNPSTESNLISGSVCDNFMSNVLEAGKSYSLSRNCMQNGLDNLSDQYRVSGDGFVTLFVEADGTSLDISKEIRSQNDNRILLVSEAEVDISPDMGYDSPATDSRPNIEMGIVSMDSINFNSNGDEDTTIILESPIATKNGAVNFSRDRGLDNGYPAEVVVYNPIYLSEFEAEEQPGLEVVNILWTSAF